MAAGKQFGKGNSADGTGRSEDRNIHVTLLNESMPPIY
jgi:hypothetical protein